MLQKLKSIQFLPSILLAVIILLQAANISRIFINDKNEYHCDEISSYGLANSFYQPFIESDDVYSWDFHHVDEWFSGEVYRNYMTVQKDQRFRYDSVWYNQSKDRHPPLFYAALHTVCSFFPDTFSEWFGFIPNLIYFAVTQFFLCKLAKNTLKSKYLALLVCTVFGITPAAVNNTLFIRMYCMLVMWAVIFMYLHSRLQPAKQESFLKHFLPIAVITFLGSMTQYLFLFVAFVTAVYFCLWYLIRKKYKAFLKYSLSMLSGVALFFIVYPPAIRHIFIERNNAVNDLREQLVFSVRYIFEDTFCIPKSHVVWLTAFLPPMCGILMIMSFPLLFLFRDRIKNNFPKIKLYFQNKFSSLKNKNIFVSVKNNPVFISMLLSFFTILFITSYTVFFAGGYAERYFYIISPFTVIIILGSLYRLISKLHFGKILNLLLTVFLCVNIFLRIVITPAWTPVNSLNLNTLFDKSNVLLILQREEHYGIMSTMGYEFFNTDNVFFTNAYDIRDDMPKITAVPSDSPLYIMTADNYHVYENADFIDSLLKKCTLIGTYRFIQGEFLIYKVQ